MESGGKGQEQKLQTVFRRICNQEDLTGPSQYSICIYILKILNKEQEKNLKKILNHSKITCQETNHSVEKNNFTIYWSFQSLSNPSFPKKHPIPQEDWNAAFAISIRSHSPGQLKTEKYFPCSWLSPTACYLQTNPPAMLTTTFAVQKEGKYSIRMTGTEGSCMQEYFLSYPFSHKSLINFPWQLRKFLFDWQGKCVLRCQKGAQLPLKGRNTRKGSLFHCKHTWLR